MLISVMETCEAQHPRRLVPDWELGLPRAWAEPHAGGVDEDPGGPGEAEPEWGIGGGPHPGGDGDGAAGFQVGGAGCAGRCGRIPGITDWGRSCRRDRSAVSMVQACNSAPVGSSVEERFNLGCKHQGSAVAASMVWVPFRAPIGSGPSCCC